MTSTGKVTIDAQGVKIHWRNRSGWCVYNFSKLVAPLLTDAALNPELQLELPSETFFSAKLDKAEGELEALQPGEPGVFAIGNTVAKLNKTTSASSCPAHSSIEWWLALWSGERDRLACGDDRSLTLSRVSSLGATGRTTRTAARSRSRSSSPTRPNESTKPQPPNSP